MKKLFTFFAAATIAVSLQAQTTEYQLMIDDGSYSVQEIIDSAESYFENRDKGKGSGYKQFKRWEYNAMRLMNEEGYLKTASEQIATLESYNAYLNENSQNRQVVNDNWVELGPQINNPTSSWAPGVGRITEVAIDPNDDDTLLVGANTGGVWRTTDGGQSWEPLSDFFTNLSVFSVSFDPNDSNTYFFGSDDGLIFKSTDAGSTWQQIGDVSNSLINKILIDPTDSDHIFASSENAGLYVTLDGGTTWVKPIVGENFSFDVEFKADDPTVVLAGGINIYKSTDGGLTFTDTTPFGFDFAATMMGVSIDDPNVVYAIQGNGGQTGLFKSTDAGTTYEEIDLNGKNYLNLDANADGTGGQAPRDMDIVVNPTNADEVHIGGGNTWRSQDGGITWELTSFWFLPNQQGLGVGYSHADVDFMTFLEGTDVMYAATDGGLFRADDASEAITTTYFTDLSEGLGIHQFYKIGVSQGDDLIISGGSQDNGTSVYRGDTGTWVGWLGADGGGNAVSPFNENRIIGTTQFGNVFRTTNAGNSITNNTATPPGQGNFVTPVRYDFQDANTAYIGFNRIYKTTNFASSWQAISQAFSGNNAVTDVQVSQSNDNILFACIGGLLYKTTDGGATDWNTTTSPGIGLINAISIHPNNPDLIAVTGTGANKVRVSRDGGTTWENYRFNLPNFSALSIAWDHNGKEGLYVGMDYGVYYIDNTLTEYDTYSTNLPNVIINDLQINSVTDMLYAGTYGRGVWETPLVDSTLNTTEVEINDYARITPNPANNSFNIVMAEPVEADVYVFDLQGKLMINKKDMLLEGSSSINISALSTGTYFVRIESQLGTLTKKLLKQ